MKESKIIEIKNKVEVLASALTGCLKELEAIKTLAKGTLTAFQLHIGKEDWDKIVEQLKDLEKRDVEQ